MTEHDDALVRPSIKGLEGLSAEIGVHGDGICLQMIKCGSCILHVGVADVASLSVEYDCDTRCVLNDIHDRLAKCSPPLITMRFIERRVWLVGRDDVFCRINDRAIECKKRRSRILLPRRLWYLFELTVEPHADELPFIPFHLEKLPKIPRTLPHCAILSCRLLLLPL